MFDDSWRGGTRGSAPLRVILGCVLLSTGAWGQSADAGRTDAGGLGPTGVPDAGQTVLGADGGQAASAAPGLAGAPDAGPSDAARVEVKLHGVPVTVTASSVLADAKAPGRYGLANLLDEDPGSIWAEGAKGSGVGEWVELSFPPDTPVHSFLVMPGNPKSAKLYKANARPRKAKLELKLAEGRKLDYVLDFPRDFPVGGAIYVHYRRQFAVKSARLTVLTVWPGSRYRDLCLGDFVPVFRGPEERSLPTFPGTGRQLAPTLAEFMDAPSLVFRLLPPASGGVPALLRSYSRVPHNGSLPPPEEEFDMHHLRGWDRYTAVLRNSAAGAAVQSELFRLTPATGGKGYVFDPLGPPKGPDSFSNFRVHWAQVEGVWRVVGVDATYEEERP
ncbi:NADase-type glycan-binding domain-containing protein [Pyxidicoccus xibeiensis]|uniref:NADase-type glycan-binding domain-containing protein n=1 Tax=Pyxidicoccus xibeiensis TaxID=2906759 RepID=UPI0020A7A8F3|nr:hypothetical protein [Pyxidicoccus xibeiensis]MCP3136407.1 hypothetical protein [Pyxidicoccus xibeiensis]